MSVQLIDGSRSVREQVSAEEWAARVEKDRAACIRLAERLDPSYKE